MGWAWLEEAQDRNTGILIGLSPLKFEPTGDDARPVVQPRDFCKGGRLGPPKAVKDWESCATPSPDSGRTDV